MASIAQLTEVAERNRPKQDWANQGLMQNAVVKKNTGVELHGQSTNEHNYAAGSKKAGPKKVKQNNQTIVEENSGNIDALQHQTEVLRDQGVATQKQTGILDKQSGLMQDQIQATQGVSAAVQRLYEYMKAEKSKPVAKVQNYGQGRGNTYEGEFTREGEGDNGGSLLDAINDMRRGGKKGGKKGRGKGGRWKLPRGMGGAGMMRMAGVAGGVLGGGALAVNGMNDIANHEGKDFFDGGLSSRGSGYAQSIGGGALAGAAIGSIVPVIGTAVGAAVGAALGGLGALITDNKQALNDGFNHIMGRPSDGTGTGRSKAESNDIADAAMTKGLGSVSASFESGGKGVSTVSTGKGDNGGVSYGSHQLSSKTGSMTAFLRSEQGSKYYDQFRGLQPGTKEFNEKYKEIAKNDGAGFEEAQNSYITKTHYAPVAGHFKDKYGVDPEQRSRALKEAMYSVGVQYGAGGAKKLTDEAWDGVDVSKADDAELIQKLQDYRASSVTAKFKSSSGAVQQSVANRAKDENTALQKMLKNEREGKSGSGIGSVYSEKAIAELEHKNGAGTVGVMAPTKPGADTSKMGAGTVGIMAAGGGAGTTTMQAAAANNAVANAPMVKAEDKEPKQTKKAAEITTISSQPAAANDPEARAKAILDQAVKQNDQNAKQAEQNVQTAQAVQTATKTLAPPVPPTPPTVPQPATPTVNLPPSQPAPPVVDAGALPTNTATMPFGTPAFAPPTQPQSPYGQYVQSTADIARDPQQPQQNSTLGNIGRNIAGAAINPLANVLGNAARVSPISVSGGIGGKMTINKPSFGFSDPKQLLEQLKGGYSNSANSVAQQGINAGISTITSPINDALMAPQRAITGGLNDLLSGKNPFASAAPAPQTFAPAQPQMQVMQPQVAPMNISPESPASQSFYRNETPIATKASSAPTQTMAQPVATQAAPEKVERQPFDSVQKVAIADAGAAAAPADGGGMGAGGGGGGGGKGGEQNNTAQLEEIPAIMDDLGILFISMGYV